MANKVKFKNGRQVGFVIEQDLIDVIEENFSNRTEFYTLAAAEKLNSMDLLPKEYQHLIGA